MEDLYHLTMRELPADSRPRERLAQLGAENLATAELLAIILRTGSRGRTALDLAQLLLTGEGDEVGLRYLATASLNELAKRPGIGLVKAIQVKAALELGRRLVREGAERGPSIRSPRDVFSLVGDEMRLYDREHFRALHLNTKNQVLAQETVAVGSLSAALVHPRELFKGCVKRSAAAVILLHNHPSGDPEPSSEDIALTRRLVEAGSILGIEVLDHLVIGDGCYVSLKERGLLGLPAAGTGSMDK
ncbi:MAG: DNA repair protein RadC [Firmicutes bacterium]|jgi:DNA repair protein RadC|nr:DNA repair protein RadC [Bacillota bacterium]